MLSLLHTRLPLLLLAISTTVLSQSLNVTVPLDIDLNMTPRYAQDQIALSLEGDRWLDWVGSTSRNQFFYNTLSNIKFYTNEPVPIRVGANSEDRTHFNPDVKVRMKKAKLRRTGRY